MNAETIGYLILSLCLLLMNALFCGFFVIIHSISSSDIDKNEEALGEKLCARLRKIEEHEISYENRALIAVVVVTTLLGGITIPRLFGRCCDFVLQNIDRTPSFLQSVPEVLLSGFLFAALLFIDLVFMLTFTVLIPRRIIRHLSFRKKAHFASVVMTVSVVIKPVTNFTNLLAKGILRIFGIKAGAEKADVTEEEIISMVNEGHELGVLEAGEAEMITNIFEYGDKEAKDIMTKRSNITAIDAEMGLYDAIDFMLEEKNSRYPVFEENLDHIIGILHFKDAIRFHNENKRAKAKLSSYPELLREAVYVPETKNIDDLFKEMQSNKLQMVIVADEYGQTSGLVAMEDILEEIVGNIMDEYDEEEEYIEEKGKDRYEIDGFTPLDELEHELDITFDDDNFETLNGFMISKLEHIPQEDELFEMDYGGYHFKALEVENKSFKTISVIRNAPQAESLQSMEIQEPIKAVEES